MKWTLQYAWSTIKHRWYVLLASRKVRLPLWQALLHDLSKFTPAELPYYGKHFFGDKSDPDGFAVAWIHHQNMNPHHWEYWIPRTIHIRAAGEPAPWPMPERYVREMVADWLGASKAYTGSWEMDEWLSKNLPTMKLHIKTRSLIEVVLREL